MSEGGEARNREAALDAAYERVQAARKRVLRWLTDDWQNPPADDDSVAGMIALDEMLKRGEVEADPRWRVRRSPQPQRQDSLSEQMQTVEDWATSAGCYDAVDWMRRMWAVRCAQGRDTDALRSMYGDAVAENERLRADFAAYVDVARHKASEHGQRVRLAEAEVERLRSAIEPGGGTEGEAATPRAIAAWVREEADSKDYAAACEWRNVADAIEREGEDRGWRCECGDLNRDHESFCYRCGAGQPDPQGEDHEPGKRSEWLCPSCGHMIDTPMHELGCQDGADEFDEKDERTDTAKLVESIHDALVEWGGIKREAIEVGIGRAESAENPPGG